MKDFSVPLQISITLTLEREDEISEQKRFHLKKGGSESLLHILLKILSVCYLWDISDELIIEPRYRFHKYRPDLVTFGKTDIPNELTPIVNVWVECKTTAIKKMQKLSRYLPQSTLYWFHTDSHFRAILKTNKSKKQLQALRNLSLIGIKVQKSKMKLLQKDLNLKRPSWTLRKEGNKLYIISINFSAIIDFIKY